jgi:hypothetical protein
MQSAQPCSERTRPSRSGCNRGFTGTSDLIIVVEACTNLGNPIWSAVATNTLTTLLHTRSMAPSGFAPPRLVTRPCDPLAGYRSALLGRAIFVGGGADVGVPVGSASSTPTIRPFSQLDLSPSRLIISEIFCVSNCSNAYRMKHMLPIGLALLILAIGTLIMPPIYAIAWELFCWRLGYCVMDRVVISCPGILCDCL